MSSFNINAICNSEVPAAEGWDASVFGALQQHELASSSGHSTPACTSEENSPFDETPEVFEGPEKTLEVVFHPFKGDAEGLRKLSRRQVDFLCTEAKCSILSKTSNKHLDAYVLSESSLFIYKSRYVMKTCGTTTLLRCLSSLLEFADKLGMELTWVGYSRKNLMFPDAQHWPHGSFGDEIKYIDSHEKLQNRLQGSGHILGPVTGDHWFVYVADHPEKILPTTYLPTTFNSNNSLSDNRSDYRTINMMMFDMAPEVSEIFYQSNCPTGKEMTVKSGINHLCPGAVIDETAFEPCGYSMNAILHDAYSTIHITPQSSCSYASFETNTAVNDYSALIRNVLSVFRPKRFVVTLFAHDDAIETIKRLPTESKLISMPLLEGSGVSAGYARTSKSATLVGNDLNCLMACYSMVTSNSSSPTLEKCISMSSIASDELEYGKRERGHSFSF